MNLRLTGHETLQKILEDHAASEWDIFVTPLTIDQTVTMLSDHVEEGVPDVTALTDAFAEREGGRASVTAVKVAEHALISYFVPKYNRNLVEWNATRKTVEMEALWRANAHLCLTICQGRWEMASFFTTTQAAARSHAIASEIPAAYRARGFGSVPFAAMRLPSIAEGVDLLQKSTRDLMRDYEASDFILNVFGAPPNNRMPPYDAWSGIEW